ncbi:MAG TPA: hypothetical protein VJ978_02135 [Nitriliruptoraceae bacterium]|nr:hypothetical protein [Nitriliruptoraceae bacterium]
METAFEDDDVLVTVGSGAKAHVFRPHQGATYKVRTMQDGGSVFDRALCGSGGEMRLADDDDLCKTCASLLDTAAQQAAASSA